MCRGLHCRRLWRAAQRRRDPSAPPPCANCHEGSQFAFDIAGRPVCRGIELPANVNELEKVTHPLTRLAPLAALSPRGERAGIHGDAPLAPRGERVPEVRGQVRGCVGPSQCNFTFDVYYSCALAKKVKPSTACHPERTAGILRSAQNDRRRAQDDSWQTACFTYLRNATLVA